MMPEEFVVVTPSDPPDEGHDQLCTAMLEDSGYLLVSDVLCLVLSVTKSEHGGFCHWTLHRCAHAGTA